MFSVKLLAIDVRQVVKVERSTRSEFDKKHPGDPLWFFIDRNQFTSRNKLKDFLFDSYSYTVNDQGILSKDLNALVSPINRHIVTDPRPGFEHLTITIR